MDEIKYNCDSSIEEKVLGNISNGLKRMFLKIKLMIFWDYVCF